jgi:uncharacterized protein YndB with AHSA1/START domain
MLRTILLFIAAAIAIVLVYAATKPDTFSVERSANIHATPDRLFPLISDFHAWGAWSPWEKLDPNMKRTFGGPQSGLGATYAWAGDKAVGEGRMEITEATPSSRIVIKLDFLKPFESNNTTTFTFEPAGDTTTVRWVMTGPSPYISKLMSVFVSMDRMIGKDFETGLANLKAAAEK